MTEASRRRVTSGRRSAALVAAGRAWPSLVAGAVATGLLLALAFDAGGYFPPAFLTAGAVAFGTLAALLLLRPPHYELSGQALVALAALGGLGLWTGLSAHWSSAPDTALEDMQRTLAYAGMFGLALLAAGSGRHSRHLVWAVLGVTVVIVGAGLLSRLYPDVVHSTESAFTNYRLAYPLGYWNAFGALAALGLVLALGVAADSRSAVVARVLAAGAAVPLGVAGYLTYSRGAWLSLFAGLAVLVALSPRRFQLLAVTAIVGGPLALAVLRLRGFAGVTDDPGSHAAQVDAGHDYASTLLALTLLAAALQCAWSARRLLPSWREAAARVARPLGYATIAVLVVACVGLYFFKASTVEGGSARVLEDVEGFVDRQWDEFMTPAAVGEVGAGRLTTARGTRSDLYRIAIDGFEDSPLRGDGSGGFEYRFAHDRDVDEKVRDAHSLYLETLGELGLVGALLLLTFVAAVVAALVGARLRGDPLSRAHSAAVAAAFSVWIVHAGVDWDWQMPALTGVALTLAAAAFPVGRRRRGGRRSRQASGSR